MTSDGLAALAAQREQAKNSSRRVPPPRHAPKPSPTHPTETGVLPPQETVDQESPVSPASQVLPHVANGYEPLTRSTIYVDAASDTWLEDVALTARRSTPRADAPRSAVVRLALERLRAQMTSDQVVEQLRARVAMAPARPGRKRL